MTRATKLGARPLRRAIQRYLEDRCREVLLRKFTAGQTILVGLDAENQELTFEGISRSDRTQPALAGQ